jgi:hypothetical protein
MPLAPKADEGEIVIYAAAHVVVRCNAVELKDIIFLGIWGRDGGGGWVYEGPCAEEAPDDEKFHVHEV